MNLEDVGGVGVCSGAVPVVETRALEALPIVFSQHNLATDAAFGEMQFILCRNVLIYFNRELQERVLKLFAASLARRGFLALGAKESLGPLDASHPFETIDAPARLFRAL